jgi:hypothetical protein
MRRDYVQEHKKSATTFLYPTLHLKFFGREWFFTLKTSSPIAGVCRNLQFKLWTFFYHLESFIICLYSFGNNNKQFCFSENKKILVFCYFKFRNIVNIHSSILYIHIQLYHILKNQMLLWHTSSVIKLLLHYKEEMRPWKLYAGIDAVIATMER